MAIPSVMSDLSTTAASNSPAGTEAPSNADDFLRAIQGILRTTNAKGSDIASAATTDIGAATGEFLDVTGTTTITALGTIAAGIVRTVRFTGALTLTHNATSLILPSSANITTANGDVAQFRSLGSGNWKCVGYLPQNGSSLGGVVDSTPVVFGSADATKKVRLEADGLTTATTRVMTVPDKDITLAGLVDIRSYLAGCTLSTTGASATMSIASGQCMDSTNAFGMTLSAIAKTTAAWAVGTGNGGLDTGAIANATWYHFYVIRRPDTGVVDVVFSLNATTPSLPTNYTLYRRIGSGLTNGSAQWTMFTQLGDLFTWDVLVQDVSANNPGTAAVTRTLTVPTGVVVHPVFVARSSNVTTANYFVLFTALAQTDTTPSITAFDLNPGPAVSNPNTGLIKSIATNTSAQIRSRQSASGASDQLIINTMGWIDSRGKNA